MLDYTKNVVIGYLHKALKTANQLSMMEDALVIYRISRAPERRIFYIDVGNLPKAKAEQYLADTMNKYRNDDYIRKHVLRFTEEDISRIQKEIDSEGHDSEEEEGDDY